MRHGSLFSGIGGFDLASEWMGWENVFHCEWMEFPRKVLEYYWPEADSHIDICKTDFKKYANTIDILTGGFPCQPFSLAGKRKGTDDERYLWGEMLRAIQEIKPTWVIAENVFGITNIDGGLVFEQVCLDLEAEGYEVQPFIIPAAAKNAPHRRDRCWFIATDTKCIRLEHSKEAGNIRECKTKTQRERSKFTKPFETNGINGNAADTDSARVQGRPINTGTMQKIRQGRKGFEKIRNNGHFASWHNFPTQSPVCGGDDGLPTELDGITFSKWRKESIKGYGNAIVPQIAYELFKIIEHENKNKTTKEKQHQDIIPDVRN
jgi:DNA (cytosine-5)-methyltransferase 1